MSETDIDNEYKKLVDQCADKGEDFAIPNTDERHAAYLVKTLFRKATSEVYIFSGSLYDGVFGVDDVTNQAVKFLSDYPNAKITIAYQSPVSKEELFSRTFLKCVLKDSKLASRVVVHNASETYPGNINHFTVCDGKAFRYEYNHSTRQAIGNFGHKGDARTLVNVFKKIISNSQVVSQ